MGEDKIMTLSLDQQLLLAPQVAARAHQHQKRKDGTPYIAHPVRVAIRVSQRYTGFGTHWYNAQIAAFLHDVVEDTDITIEELRELGFNELVLSVIERVTRRPGETYSEFILRIKGDGLSPVSLLAISVKLADIDDNMEDQTALDPEEAAFFNKRYSKAQVVLND